MKMRIHGVSWDWWLIPKLKRLIPLLLLFVLGSFASSDQHVLNVVVNHVRVGSHILFVKGTNRNESTPYSKWGLVVDP